MFEERFELFGMTVEYDASRRTRVLASDSHGPGDGQRGILPEEPSQRDGKEVFVAIESRFLENGLEPLVLERLDSGPCQGKSEEPAEIAVE